MGKVHEHMWSVYSLSLGKPMIIRRQLGNNELKSRNARRNKGVAAIGVRWPDIQVPWDYGCKWQKTQPNRLKQKKRPTGSYSQADLRYVLMQRLKMSQFFSLYLLSLLPYHWLRSQTNSLCMVARQLQQLQPHTHNSKLGKNKASSLVDLQKSHDSHTVIRGMKHAD